MPSYLISLSLLFLLLTVHSKFLFNSDSISDSKTLLWPSCTLSGVRTVHLPVNDSSTFQLRLLFTPPSPTNSHSTTSSVDLFDADSHRLGRVELSFHFNHLQVSFDGLQSPWLPLIQLTRNYIEIRDTKSFKKDIRLNGKRIAPAAFIPEFQAASFKITYQDSLVDPLTSNDPDWLDLQQNLEEMNIQWQPPVKSVERITKPSQDQEASRNGQIEIDSIVYDDEILSIQLASRQPLPKLPKKSTKNIKSKPVVSLPAIFKVTLLKVNLFKSVQSQLENEYDLPVPLHTHYKTSQANHRLWILLTLPFACYLVILLKLAQMTSVRKPQPIQLTVIPPVDPVVSATSTSTSLLHAAQPVSKSPSSRTLTVSLSGSPVLKVAVPAALSLADNRHIVFPSKLRNFQK